MVVLQAFPVLAVVVAAYNFVVVLGRALSAMSFAR